MGTLNERRARRFVAWLSLILGGGAWELSLPRTAFTAPSWS